MKFKNKIILMMIGILLVIPVFINVKGQEIQPEYNYTIDIYNDFKAHVKVNFDVEFNKYSYYKNVYIDPIFHQEEVQNFKINTQLNYKEEKNENKHVINIELKEGIHSFEYEYDISFLNKLKKDNETIEEIINKENKLRMHIYSPIYSDEYNFNVTINLPKELNKNNVKVDKLYKRDVTNFLVNDKTITFKMNDAILNFTFPINYFKEETEEEKQLAQKQKEEELKKQEDFKKTIINSFLYLIIIILLFILSMIILAFILNKKQNNYIMPKGSNPIDFCYSIHQKITYNEIIKTIMYMQDQGYLEIVMSNDKKILEIIKKEDSELKIVNDKKSIQKVYKFFFGENNKYNLNDNKIEIEKLINELNNN